MINRIAYLFVGLLIVATILPLSAARSTTLVIEIEALIDGRDFLILDDNTLQWDHRDFAAVGRHLGVNEPTIITTILDGVTVLDHVEWFPTWSSPPPASISSPELSSIFTGLSPAIPNVPMTVQLDVLSARESLLLAEGPSAANGYAITLDFDDRMTGSDSTYRARLTLQYGTVVSLTGPATPAAFAVATLWLLRRGRPRRRSRRAV